MNLAFSPLRLFLDRISPLCNCVLRLDIFIQSFLTELCSFFKYLLMHIQQIIVNITPMVLVDDLENLQDCHPWYVVVPKGWTFLFVLSLQSYAPLFNDLLMHIQQVLVNTTPLTVLVDDLENFQDCHPWCIVVPEGWIFLFVLSLQSYASFFNDLLMHIQQVLVNTTPLTVFSG